jgi:hypothetical protein
MKEQLIQIIIALKNNIYPLFAVAIGLLAPIQYILLLVGAFILADTVAGVWSSKKLGKKITSNRFSSVISKMLVYNSVVILAFALDVNLLGEFLLHIVSINLLFTKVAAIALITNECYSIDEKLRNVTGKGIWFYFKRLVGIAKTIKREAEELEKKDNKELLND